MTVSARDKTTIDEDRRFLRFNDVNYISEVLPEFFVEEYPKLTTLLQSYYDFCDSNQDLLLLLNDLIVARDIQDTPAYLLKYIEDELLLGQSYFQGFQNKSAALKFSSTLYRSKGTLYSIQQFFRMFYGIDPEVTYTKVDRFILNDSDSQIGYNSRKFITDNKFYQTFALKIGVDIPLSKWIEPYKLFVHPAGMFVGGEMVIVQDASLDLDIMPDFVKAVVNPKIVEQASFSIGGVGDVTELIYTGTASQGYGTDSMARLDIGNAIRDYQDLTIDDINKYYNRMTSFLGPNSPLMSDSATADSDGLATMDQTFYSSATTGKVKISLDRFDQDIYTWSDSDSA